MADRHHPKSAAEVIDTLRSIFAYQQNAELSRLLRTARGRFEYSHYDNWDGGIHIWNLLIEVPVPAYASLGSKQTEVETTLLTSLAYLNREHPDNPIQGVQLLPLSPNGTANGHFMIPPDQDIQHLWLNGKFRLFLSHLSSDKILATDVKAALSLRGVDTFVAHEDIEPSKIWQAEIELALRSMHALAALITPGFHESKWTDQEIGWALGRGVLVIPIRIGGDPYGLMGKFQAVSGKRNKPRSLANDLTQILLTNTRTEVDMRSSLLRGLSTAASEQAAQVLVELSSRIAKPTLDERDLVWSACANNPIFQAYPNLTRSLTGTFGHPPTLNSATKEDDVPF